LKDFYIEKGISKDKIIVAHDAVDLRDFDITVDKNDVRQKLGIPLDKPVAMYLGRLDPWKGVETLLETSLLLPEVTVVIAGEGSQFKEFKKKYPNVIFLGNTPYRDLPRNQRAADVLVVPNSGKSDVSRLYTSPLKVFAHMASGVPIVASDLPSLREVLNEENSTLVESDNPKALANGVKMALKLNKNGKNALRDVMLYTWTRRVKDVVRFVI
ncbi:glycosyltransferase family 4 protein, partial [candidate division KSB1 bacterium]